MQDSFNRISYVSDQETDNLYTVYKDTGIHYRGKNVENTKKVEFVNCCLEWMGFDVKGNIFLGTDTEIIILIPLKDMYCVDDFPKTNFSDYDLSLTVLDDYSVKVKNIINNKQCLTNREEAKKIPDLDFSQVDGTWHVELTALFSIAALLIFAGIIYASLKLIKARVKISENVPTLTRENSYESIIYRCEQPL